MPKLRQLLIGALIGDVLCIIVCLPFGWLGLPVLLGLLFGTVLSLLLFVLLGMALAQSLSKSPNSAKRHVQIHYILRMLLLGIALYLGITRSYLSMPAMLVPVLSVQFTLYLTGIFGKEGKRWKDSQSTDQRS